MSTFQSFQTGLEAGQKQAKMRREDDARTKAADAFKSGNYEGAVQSLLSVGSIDEANAYGQASERKKEADRVKTYADAFKTGLGAGPAPDRKAGYQAVQGAAAEQGDFGTMAQIDQAIAGMNETEAKQFTQGMEFLGQTAMGLKGVPPEMRGQAAMEILQKTPYANPQVLAQIQQAAADGLITDEELDRFSQITMTAAERAKGEQGRKMFSTYTAEDNTQTAVFDDGTTKPLGKARPSFGTVDLGGGAMGMFDRYSGPQSVTPVTTPEQVGGAKATVAGIEASGKATAEAKGALPGAALQMKEALDVVQQLRVHKGFKDRYGGIVEATIPPLGGAGADAQALIDQIGGQAFLQAIQSLRGTGPVSEREGLAAQSSLNRLNNHNQTDAGAVKALDDFEEHVGNVYLLAQLKARAPIDVGSLTTKQRALVAEWARLEGGAQ